MDVCGNNLIMWKKGWGSYIRVNVYAEEMTDRVEIVEKKINEQVFTGVRFYLYLPVTVPVKTDACEVFGEYTQQIKGPFIHREGDDDSSAVTFWGKGGLRKVLSKALFLLDENYDKTRKGVI